MTAKPGFDINAITKASRPASVPPAEPVAQTPAEAPAQRAAPRRAPSPKRGGEGAEIEMPSLEERRRRILILVDDEMRQQIDDAVDVMRRGSVQKFVYQAIAEKLIRDGQREP